MRPLMIRIPIAVCTLVLSFATPSGQVHADILDTILDAATQAANKAEAARDRAKEARDAAEETRDNVRAGIDRITGDIQTRINEAIEDFERVLGQQLEGRSDFIADGGCSLAECEPFRQDLISLFQNLETLLNASFEIAGMDGISVDFQRLINVIQGLPGRALYPLYRHAARDTNIFDGGLLDRLAEAAAGMQELQDALQQTEAQAVRDSELGLTRLDMELVRCQYIEDSYDLIRQKVRHIGLVASGLKLLGKLYIAGGETEISAEGGVHGYLGATIKTDHLGSMGQVHDGAADALFMVANYITNMVRHCTNVRMHGDVRARLATATDAIIEKQAVQDGSLAGLSAVQQTILQGQLGILNAIQKTGCGADIDCDGDVDLIDYSLLQTDITGPQT